MSKKFPLYNNYTHRFTSYTRRSFTALPTIAGLLLVLVFFSLSEARPTKKGHQNGNWIGTWAAPIQLVEPRNMAPEPGLSDNTLRQVVHVSIGGNRLRVEFSNTFGTAPLTLKTAHIADALQADSSAIVPGTDKTLTFNGKQEITIQPGKSVMSDPISFDLKPLSNVTITIHYGHVSPMVTGHPGSRSTSYLVKGNEVNRTSLPGAVKTDHWYTIEGIQVMAPKSASSIVVLGNSITDGHASGTNKNARWPDDLARRLQANSGTKDISVLNQGIGGNCILHGCLGPTALSRFYRDVINQPKVKWLIILEGINDIGGSRGPQNANIVAERLIDSYKWMIKTAHEHGIKVYGATMTPFAGSFYDRPGHIPAWSKVNKWIRNSGRFDAVIDFDAAVRDPANPMHLLPKYDSGDHLHPGPLGYRVMADAINLKLFK